MAETTQIDYQQRLRVVQESTKTIAARRDTLNREAGAEERRVQEAYEQLKTLGVVTAATQRLTIEQLETLRAGAQKDLDEKLAAIEAQLAEGTKLLAEYDAKPVTA